MANCYWCKKHDVTFEHVALCRSQHHFRKGEMVYTKQEVLNFALQNEGLRDWLVRYTSTTDDTHMNRIVRGYTIVHAKHAAERQCPEGYKVKLVSPTTKHWVETLEPANHNAEKELQQLKQYIYAMNKKYSYGINFDDYDYWS